MVVIEKVLLEKKIEVVFKLDMEILILNFRISLKKKKYY